MKLGWVGIGGVVAAFSAGSWTQAQTQNPGQTQTQTQTPTQDPDKDQPNATDVHNAPKQAAAALPTQEDSQIKHDGTKTDEDAVGNRNAGCGRGVGHPYTVAEQWAPGRV